jgi:VanZ family protein
MQPDTIERNRVVEALWYWGPVVLYAGLIFYLSCQSHPERYIPTFMFLEVGDKVLHAIEYALLGFLCYRAFRHAAGTLGGQYAVLLAVVAATIYGATDEWHQAFVPFREPDRWDLATDLLGALVGVVAWVWIERRRIQGWNHGAHAMASAGQTGISQSATASSDVTLEPGAR